MIARRLLPLSLVLLLPALAAADEKNPATEACVGKAEGAPCSAERIVQGPGGKAEKRSEPGACQPDECCELDYASGPPPKTTCGPCLACKPGGAPASGDSGGSGPQVEPPRADSGDPPAVPPNDKRGCSIADTTEPPGALAWLLGLGLWVTRRRGLSRRTPCSSPWSRR